MHIHDEGWAKIYQPFHNKLSTEVFTLQLHCTEIII